MDGLVTKPQRGWLHGDAILLSATVPMAMVPCLEPKRCLIWVLNSESSNSIRLCHSLLPFQNLCLYLTYCICPRWGTNRQAWTLGSAHVKGLNRGCYRCPNLSIVDYNVTLMYYLFWMYPKESAQHLSAGALHVLDPRR